MKNNIICNTPPPHQNNRVKSNTYSETGRSMVEMLGVLAVIGVLSVGGIAAYKNAMNRHEANSIRNEVNRRVVVWASDNAFGRDFSPFNKNALGYQWQDPQGMGDFIQFGVSGIEAEICEKVKSNDWKMVYVNENCTIFAFKNDLTQFVPQKTCSECNEECGECNKLTGECVPNNNRCHSNKPYCGANGICTQCENGLWNSAWNKCGECSSAAGFPNYTQTDCHVCDNRYLTTSGKCVYCEVPFAENFVEDKSECLERCPNYNVFSTKPWNQALTAGAVGGCYYCDPQYSVPSENRDECIQVNSCPEGQYFGFGSCSICDAEEVAQNKTSKEQCERCKGFRYFSVTGNRCVGKSLEYDSVNKRNWAGVEKEYCLAMKNAPLFFYGTDEKSGICEWCPTEIKMDVNGEKVCADTCPTGTYLYLEHKQGGKNSCCPNNATCAGRKTKCNAGYYLNADGTACNAS